MLAGEGAKVPMRGRLDYLDGIRALAALFVVAHHVYLQVYPRFPENTGPWFLGWLLYGNFAVAVFIVVSGYSLTLAPARRQFHLGMGYWPYLKRRAWRILPAYWAAVLLSSLIFVVLIEPRADVSIGVRDVLVHLGLVQDMIRNTPPNGALWSIAVEWQLYFVFPLFLLARRVVGPAATAALGVVGVWAVNVLARNSAPFHRLLNLTPQFAALFIFGMLAAAATVRREQRSRVPWGWITLGLAVAGVAACAALGSERVLGVDLYWSDLAIGTVAACLLAALSGPGTTAVKRFLQHRRLVSTGHFSYSIYLVHAPILAVGWLYVVEPLHWSRNASFVTMAVIVVPVAIAASYGFYLLIERPFMNRRAAVTSAARPPA
ncbi:MAG: acyltransferase family protein [Acidimicrobiales bacterium]